MRILILIIFSILLSSCDYLNNLISDDEIVTREINSGTIKSIIVNSACKIELLPNTSDTITIEGYSYLIDDLQITFGEDSITIDHKNNAYLQKSKMITFRIPANNLKLIRTFAICELETQGIIIPEKLNIVINGQGKYSNANLSIENTYLMLHVYDTRNIGDYYVEGSSTSASFLLEGAVSIDAGNFKCENIKVNHKSVKDCYVNPTQSLQVSIYSSGNTFYSGNPSIESAYVNVPYFSATGEVIKME